MTFLEKYHQCNKWQDKVTVMELYHLTGILAVKSWTISHTATYFGVSNGLVSENLKLALALHSNPKIVKIETRQEALRKLR
jgi:hypothetical protein